MSIDLEISSLATYTNYFFLNNKLLDGHKDSDIREICKRSSTLTTRKTPNKNNGRKTGYSNK